jgi:hypothetical protein
MYSHRGEKSFNPRASRYLMCRNEFIIILLLEVYFRVVHVEREIFFPPQENFFLYREKNDGRGIKKGRDPPCEQSYFILINLIYKKRNSYISSGIDLKDA